MSKKEEKRAVLRTAIWIAIIGCLGSVAIGFAANLIFGFEVAPTIMSGTTLTAVMCALSPVYVKGQKEEDGEK